jgi:prophage tail gpP-like protein
MSEYIMVNNAKSGKNYKIEHFNSYMVDQSLDVPADGFNFAINDPQYSVSSKISAGDELDFYVNEKKVLNGLVDTMDINSDPKNGTKISISGRDKISLLLDNDAFPKTLYRLNLKQYLDQTIKSYGFSKITVSDSTPFDKIQINVGESEFTVIQGLCQLKGIYPRYDVDSFICTMLRADTNRDYLFSNDFTKDSIKIKSYQISISGDVKNEVLIYSATYGRSHTVKSRNVKASASDPSLHIHKRIVLNEGNAENAQQAEDVAKKTLKDHNRGAFTITIDTHTDVPIFVNKIAHVVIKSIGLDCYMIVNKTTYTKDKQSGSVTKVELKLIEGVTTTWGNHNIPQVPR